MNDQNMDTNSMNAEDPVTKSDIREKVADAPYPCDRDQLLEYAEQNGADDAELDLIRALPNTQYHSLDDVDQALGTPISNDTTM
jgi:hypothetical protein